MEHAPLLGHSSSSTGSCGRVRGRERERERDGERKVRELCRAVDLQTETVCSGGSASLSGCSDSRCFDVRVWFGMVSREC